MTSPLSVISAGNFFTGLIFEYSSLGWPGTTAAGTNSILSIRPSSIAAMRTLRANGEAGENVSFIWYSLKNARARIHPSLRAKRSNPEGREGRRDCFVAESVIGRAFARPVGSSQRRRRIWRSRRDDFLPLLAETFDAEGDHVAGVEEFRRLHARADTGRRARGDDVTRQQREKLRDVRNALRHGEDHRRCRPGLTALAVDIEPHRQLLHIRYLVL